MSISRVLRVSRSELRYPARWLQLVRALFPALLLSALVGCSSAVTKLETWEGDPATAVNAATLKAPGAIQVSRVNGRSMTNYLMDDLALDYALLPGENEVVFTYKTIWAKSGVVDNGESKVHVIKSKPQVARFEASPNETYRFEFDKPESRQQAEQVMPEFSAAIVGSDGQTLVQSSDWSPAESTSVGRTPLSGSTAAAGGTLSEDGMTSLERLKAVWATATDEEKKTFLRWAFE
ncbi:DUF2057 family protein [Marinobacter sp. 1_MG-2023]|uniref:DUF2057 family protein n=1 Tax=Marinobacter sp. 1_MG-2023 TaxID=3062627 RepID=UPI0026E2F90C|nr:DUF2057 family protein [Marinobacter sp. 1_MG-2023]MDO6825176.1 DUF2057 family protein [Marinobacter sp. 1_MG-2023]